MSMKAIYFKLRMSTFTSLPTPTAGGKRILIVSSHPNVGKSFNHQLIAAAKGALEADGHVVVVDDLIERGFNATGGPHDFTSIGNEDFFDYQAEQKRAVDIGAFATDVQDQMNLLVFAD